MQGRDGAGSAPREDQARDTLPQEVWWLGEAGGAPLMGGAHPRGQPTAGANAESRSAPNRSLISPPGSQEEQNHPGALENETEDLLKVICFGFKHYLISRPKF